MTNNSNMILLLISIIVVFLAGICYLEFKKIKIELDKHKETLAIYKEKIELLLNLNEKIMKNKLNDEYIPSPPTTYDNNTLPVNNDMNVELNNDENIQMVDAHIEDSIEVVEIDDGEVENVVEVLTEDDAVVTEDDAVVTEDDAVVTEVVTEDDTNIVEDEEFTINISNDIDNMSIDDISIDNISIDNSENDITEVYNNEKKKIYDEYVQKSVKELRDILTEKGLHLSGNKTKLVNRILDNM